MFSAEGRMHSVPDVWQFLQGTNSSQTKFLFSQHGEQARKHAMLRLRQRLQTSWPSHCFLVFLHPKHAPCHVEMPSLRRLSSASSVLFRRFPGSASLCATNRGALTARLG